jgi:hypothetical protein
LQGPFNEINAAPKFLYSTNDDELLNATGPIIYLVRFAQRVARGLREIHYYVKFACAFPPALYNDSHSTFKVTE